MIGMKTRRIHTTAPDRWQHLRLIGLLCGLVALTGCAQVLEKPAALLAPSVEVADLTLDPPEALPRDTAIAFVIKRLNTTQYGVVLQDVFSRASRLFDYEALLLRLRHKRVRGLLTREDRYLVVLLNTCAAPDESVTQEFFEKTYSFATLEEARRICAAFIAAGVRPCCDDGCEE